MTTHKAQDRWHALRLVFLQIAQQHALAQLTLRAMAWPINPTPMTTTTSRDFVSLMSDPPHALP